MTVYADEIFGRCSASCGSTPTTRRSSWSTPTRTPTARRSSPATAAPRGASSSTSRSAWSASTCRSPCRWPTTPSAAGRPRCSATPTSTGRRASTSTRAARSSPRAGRTRLPRRRPRLPAHPLSGPSRRRASRAGRRGTGAGLARLSRPPRPRPRSPARATADLAVVGGGYTGLWTALLAKERDPGRASSCSRATGSAGPRRAATAASAPPLTHGEDNGRAALARRVRRARASSGRQPRRIERPSPLRHRLRLRAHRRARPSPRADQVAGSRRGHDAAHRTARS